VPGEASLELVAKSDVMKVFYKDLATDAEIRIEVPEGVSPMLKVDVNRDGTTDPRDTYYGVRDHSEPCVGYLITDRFTTKCGTLASNADLKVTVGDNGTDFTWTIPKRELSTDKEGASFVIAYFSKSQGWNYFPSAAFSNPIKIKF